MSITPPVARSRELPSSPRSSARSYTLLPESPSTRRARKKMIKWSDRLNERVESQLGRSVGCRRLVVVACSLVALSLVGYAHHNTQNININSINSHSALTPASLAPLVVDHRPPPEHDYPLKQLAPVRVDADDDASAQVQVEPEPQLGIEVDDGAESEPGSEVEIAPDAVAADIDNDAEAGGDAGVQAEAQAEQEANSGTEEVDEVVDGVDEGDGGVQVEGPSRFLVVGWMGEQETKAQFHLYQLGLLALALNRTLVLPNVHRARFGNCYSNPFSLYYDANSLDAFAIPWISHDDWLAYLDASPARPSAQIVALSRGEAVPDDVAILPLDHFCLAPTQLDLTSVPPRAFFSPTNDWKARAHNDFGDKVARALQEQDEDQPIDVLVMQYNLRYSLLTPDMVKRLNPDAPMPAQYSYFKYSDHWTTLGHAIASGLSPYIAVHWRTETVAPANLEACGSALIRRLETLKRQHPEITRVYLAMDYPIEALQQHHVEGEVAHSGTMTKTLTEAHHVAMRAFLVEFSIKLASKQLLELTSFSRELEALSQSQHIPEAIRGQDGTGSGAIQDDPAVSGIVDKVVLMQAQLFLIGDSAAKGSHQCAKASQFTTQIITGRRAAAQTLWNQFDIFSIGRQRE